MVMFGFKNGPFLTADELAREKEFEARFETVLRHPQYARRFLDIVGTWANFDRSHPVKTDAMIEKFMKDHGEQHLEFITYLISVAYGIKSDFYPFFIMEDAPIAGSTGAAIITKSKKLPALIPF
jgi:hypothetical protein